MSIRVKVFLLITAIVVMITGASIGLSIFFAQQQILKTIEKDMLLIAAFADELVTGKINLLKANASTAAQVMLNTPDEALPRVLKEQVEAYEDFMAITIFNREGIAAEYGTATTPAELVNSEYLQRAYAGKMIISTTRQDTSGQLVFHVCVPMDDRVLSVTIPGMIFSDFLSKFKIWETGHVFIDDKEGTVIANPRPEWVLQRYNFIERAKTDSQYQEMANTISRMIQGETGIGRFSVNKIERICAFMPITGSEAGWSLGVIAPLTESTFIQIRELLLIAAAVFFSLGLLAAFFASRSIARPFQQIQEQNIRLAELNEIALSASKAKSTFLAKMSHEMRTPLNAIIGLSELSLGKEQLPPPVEENLEKVYNSGMTLLGIVNDLLDISKIESGKFDIIPAEYDLPSLINDTISLNIIRIGSKPITFKLLIDETLPSRLLGDELRIKQIFNNLLSNAFKYTKEGTVEWRVSAEQEGDTVWLTAVVRDSGIGIRPEDRDKLFTDYSRLDMDNNRNMEGTGLGLALTKSIVEFMDGTITLESEYGKGSIFTVRFRQQSVNAKSIGQAVAENLKNFRYTDQKRSRNVDLVRIRCPYAKVLVVDDVPINLDVARGMLKPYGMQVDCAKGGREAVELIQKEAIRYNAVFMDHMMPDMDGIEAVRVIREELGTEYARTVPIIVLTANAIAGNEEMFLQHGFQDFLSKPIDIMRLDTVIHRWVRNKALEKEGQGKVPDASETSSLLEAFKGIDGLDIPNALARLGGNEKALLKIFRSYTVNIHTYLDKLSVPGPEQLAQYTITIHGIKGASYSIGANKLGKEAEALEWAARREDMDFISRNNDAFIVSAKKLSADLTVRLDEGS
ncbi:ATP-binding protein [Breznakiellaceae bacterium SP9]